MSKSTKSGTTLTGSALFYVRPDTAYRMVIEEDPQYDNNTPMPYDVIEFSGTDRFKYAYAILRDRFGNFAGFSTRDATHSLKMGDIYLFWQFSV